MKRLRIFLIGFLVLLLVAGGAFVAWAETPLGPMPEAVAALESNAEVTVQTEPWLLFAPGEQMPAVGLIFYPGGRVDPRSYAPAARAIAAQGYLVVIPPVPLNLALFAPDIAADVIAANPAIKRWFVGGHSLGGAMAADFAYKNPELVDGLVLWASYPAGNSDFSTRPDFPILSVFGSLDMGLEGIEASRTLLPSSVDWVEIAGGNHAQCGWYGSQPGDNPATISREDQQAQLIAATVGFLAAHR
ncbi:MAG: alpha/beta hydrolase [Caldilineaceae bacterium]